MLRIMTISLLLMVNCIIVSSLEHEKRIYFGNPIEPFDRQFYYYTINFKHIDHDLSFVVANYNQITTPSDIIRLGDTQNSFRTFINVVDKRNEMQKAMVTSQKKMYMFFTSWITSIYNVPAFLEQWPDIRKRNNNNNDNLNRLNITDFHVDQMIKVISLITLNIDNALNISSTPIFLPNIFKLPNMPWPLWINAAWRGGNFTIKFQLFKYLPFLLPILLPFPILKAPPYNSIFALKEVGNYSNYYLGTSSYKGQIISTLISKKKIEDNCNETVLCVLPFPEQCIIVVDNEMNNISYILHLHETAAKKNYTQKSLTLQNWNIIKGNNVTYFYYYKTEANKIINATFSDKRYILYIIIPIIILLLIIFVIVYKLYKQKKDIKLLDYYSVTPIENSERVNDNFE